MIWLIPNLPVLFFILGVIYGFLHPGREKRLGILKKSIGIGVILGIIFGSIFAFFLPGLFGILALGATVLAFVFLVLSIAVPFVIGTIVGDLIEGLLK